MGRLRCRLAAIAFAVRVAAFIAWPCLEKRTFPSRAATRTQAAAFRLFFACGRRLQYANRIEVLAGGNWFSVDALK
jgi:hypothetical protein